MNIKLVAAKDMQPGDHTGHDFRMVVEAVSEPFYGKVLIKWLGEDVTINPEGHRFPVEVPEPDYQAALRDMLEAADVMRRILSSKGIATLAPGGILLRHGINPEDLR